MPEIKGGSQVIKIAVYNGKHFELANILLSNGYKVQFKDVTNDVYSWQDNYKGVLVIAELQEKVCQK